MQDAQKLLIKIVREKLYNTEQNTSYDNLSADKLTEVLLEARQQAVFPMAFACLKGQIKNELALDVYADYERIYLSFIATGIRNRANHNELHKLLTMHDIPYVILKGQASARYYNDPMLRQMGDVDFLVNETDIERTDAVLRDAGFVKDVKTDNHGFHWEYVKNESIFEMHWGVPGVPDVDNKTIKKYISTIIDDRTLFINAGSSYYVPSDFHHGLVLLLHTISHLTSSGVGLRHLCDWLVFENSKPEQQFTDLFETPLKKMGIWRFAKVITKTGILYFGCENRNWCSEIDVMLCAEFLEDIFAGGNFGRKDTSRRSQAKLIRDNRSRKISHRSILHNIMSNINTKVKKQYPFLRKTIILLPLGWLLVVGQYTGRVLTGKRENALSAENYSNAASRQRVYGAMRLFEPED